MFRSLNFYPSVFPDYESKDYEIKSEVSGLRVVLNLKSELGGRV